MNEILWLIAGIGLIVAIFVVIFFLLLRRSGDEREITTGGGPLGALHDRYVKGEITLDQYLAQSKEVQENTPENTVNKFSRYL